jgi:hypothetical protein
MPSRIQNLPYASHPVVSFLVSRAFLLVCVAVLLSSSLTASRKSGIGSPGEKAFGGIVIALSLRYHSNG